MENIKIKKMKENIIESSLSHTGITQEIIEKKILSKFPYLNDQKQLKIIFSSYDFRQDEETMVKVWEEILKYLFLDIFSTFGMKISEIKSYTIIENHVPVGLMNIIQEFIIMNFIIRIFQKYIQIIIHLHKDGVHIFFQGLKKLLILVQKN